MDLSIVILVALPWGRLVLHSFTENDFDSTSHTIRLSTDTTETELQNYFEVVDDTINEPIQYLALVVSVNPEGNKVCFFHERTGHCQGHNGSTLLKIIDNDRMFIKCTVPFVHCSVSFCSWWTLCVWMVPTHALIVSVKAFYTCVLSHSMYILRHRT